MKLFALIFMMSFSLSLFAQVQDYVEVSEQEAKLIQRAVYEGVSKALFQCERTEGDETYPESASNVASLFKYYLLMGQTKVYVQDKAQPALLFVFQSAITTQESFITTNKNQTVIKSLVLKSMTVEKKVVNEGTLTKPVCVERKIPVSEFKIECHYR